MRKAPGVHGGRFPVVGSGGGSTAVLPTMGLRLVASRGGSAKRNARAVQIDDSPVEAFGG